MANERPCEDGNATGVSSIRMEQLTGGVVVINDRYLMSIVAVCFELTRFANTQRCIRKGERLITNQLVLECILTDSFRTLPSGGFIREPLKVEKYQIPTGVTISRNLLSYHDSYICFYWQDTQCCLLANNKI